MAVWTDNVGDADNGDYVLFEWGAGDPLDLGIENGMILTKRIACVAGQVLSLDGKEFFCDGRHVGTAQRTTSKGEPVASFDFTGEIPVGRYFVVGDNPMSYDSRYFGFVYQGQLLGKVIFGI